MAIVFLEDPRCEDPLQVGGKAANLAKLASQHRVPPAFALTTSAFQQWGDARRSDGAAVPADMLAAVTEAYGGLANRTRDAEPPVAVRSSAIDEDGADDSFAGQHDTFLNVVGAEPVARSVVRCWSSLDSDVAMSYRQSRGVATEDPTMGVVVQSLIRADVAGVAFSANPVTGARDEVVLNAAWGLGESVVSGTVTPDNFLVDKRSQAIASRAIGEKERMTVLTADGVSEVPVPRVMRSAPTLNDDQVAEIAQLATTLEDTFSAPVDIEWAFANDQLYLLQCRPITTLA